MAMKMEFSLGQRLELKMKLAPQILQSIEILQLPTLDLLQRVKQELVENPVLELDEERQEEEEDDSENTEASAEDKAQDESGAETEDTKEEQEDDQPTIEDIAPMMDNWNEYGSSAPKPAQGEKDQKLEAMLNTADRGASLQDCLFEQFNLLDVSDRQKTIGTEIIYNIDNDGYLRAALSDLFLPENCDITQAEAEETLRIVQDLDPPGVGARNLKECLLLQMANGNEHPLARRLVREHLEDIEKNRYPKMSRELGEPIENIKAAVEFITHLSPRPGALYSEEMPQYITPDVIVEQNDDGDYDVRLEDERIPRLHISSMYVKLLQNKNSSEEEREFVKKKVQSARWLIDAIEQRRNTLLRVCRVLFDIQRDFLDHGVKRLNPLKMRAVAERVDVHVSTVSRAIAEKYVQTPRGIFPLKYFFTGGTKSVNGKMESRKSVKQHVEEVIKNEDKNNPLSDEDVAKTLKQRGMSIARRTVTKYRKAMNIPTSRRRKAY